MNRGSWILMDIHIDNLYTDMASASYYLYPSLSLNGIEKKPVWYTIYNICTYVHIHNAQISFYHSTYVCMYIYQYLNDKIIIGEGPIISFCFPSLRPLSLPSPFSDAVSSLPSSTSPRPYNLPPFPFAPPLLPLPPPPSWFGVLQRS